MQLRKPQLEVLDYQSFTKRMVSLTASRLKANELSLACATAHAL